MALGSNYDTFGVGTTFVVFGSLLIFLCSWFLVLGEVPDSRYNISVNFVKDGWVGEYANSNTWLAFPDGNMAASFLCLAGDDVTIGIESAAVDEFKHSPTQPSFTKFIEILYLPCGTSPRTKNHVQGLWCPYAVNMTDRKRFNE